jgi:hypothetical protein
LFEVTLGLLICAFRKTVSVQGVFVHANPDLEFISRTRGYLYDIGQRLHLGDGLYKDILLSEFLDTTASSRMKFPSLLTRFALWSLSLSRAAILEVGSDKSYSTVQPPA